MSERLRFSTARQVFEAFPNVVADIDPAPGEDAALDFAQGLLAAPRGFDGIAYVAALLPRREAVWWGCQCVRAIDQARTLDSSLAAAEAWVRDPDDATRRAALALGAPGDLRSAVTWLALAAGHSGGSIAPETSPPVAALPQATALNVKVAIILAIVNTPLAGQAGWTRACVEAGIRFAEGGDARVRAPVAPKAGGDA